VEDPSRTPPRRQRRQPLSTARPRRPAARHQRLELHCAAPCKRELPAFAAFHAELGDHIRFVGVNNLDSPDVNESFARERGVGYELLRDVNDGFASTVGIATLPVTLFVDADGTIVRQTGVLEEDELREYAEELLR
jgi:thiol-disulfide isomerase/thioredoxin